MREAKVLHIAAQFLPPTKRRLPSLPHSQPASAPQPYIAAQFLPSTKCRAPAHSILHPASAPRANNIGAIPHLARHLDRCPNHSPDVLLIQDLLQSYILNRREAHAFSLYVAARLQSEFFFITQKWPPPRCCSIHRTAAFLLPTSLTPLTLGCVRRYIMATNKSIYILCISITITTLWTHTTILALIHTGRRPIRQTTVRIQIAGDASPASSRG